MKEINPKEIALRVAEYVVCFLLFTYFTTALHEWLHLSVLKWLGGDGYITKTWYGGAVVFTEMPSNPTIVAFAGGIGIAILYTILFLWDYYDNDYEEAAALLPVIGGQLAYGLYEGFFIYTIPFSEFMKWSEVVSVTGWTVGLLIGFYIMFKGWIKEEVI